jgi:RNA polymerase sigma-70 factor (ECF subfamily)
VGQDDAELLGRLRAGDLRAFDAAYDRYGEKIYNLCLRLVRNESDARDLTQEAFVVLLRKVGTFRGEARFSRWFYRVATNLAISFLRKGRRLVLAEDAEHETELEEHPALRAEHNPVDALQLQRAIEELPDGYRVVFVLYEVYGYTHEEIAETCGCSVGNSKAQLFRARDRLRKKLNGGAGDAT